jgi:hypothetical protein
MEFLLIQLVRPANTHWKESLHAARVLLDTDARIQQTLRLIVTQELTLHLETSGVRAARLVTLVMLPLPRLVRMGSIRLRVTGIVTGVPLANIVMLRRKHLRRALTDISLRKLRRHALYAQKARIVLLLRYQQELSVRQDTFLHRKD